MTDALLILEENGLIHLDFKTDNILHEYFFPTLIDFETFRELDSKKENRLMWSTGTQLYRCDADIAVL